MSFHSFIIWGYRHFPLIKGLLKEFRIIIVSFFRSIPILMRHALLSWGIRNSTIIVLMLFRFYSYVTLELPLKNLCFSTSLQKFLHEPFFIWSHFWRWILIMFIMLRLVIFTVTLRWWNSLRLLRKVYAFQIFKRIVIL